MTDEQTPALKVVGWGPFPLPGEKKRHQRALEEARETMRLVEEIEARGKTQEERDDE
jgi:hypothetical protein